jgi:hypothetical protein
VEVKTLAALESSVATLTAKAPGELDAYRALVLEIATSVSEAAGGGDRVEAQAIDKIKAAVGASSGTSSGT